MKLKHLFVSLFAAAAVFAGCEKEKNEDSGLPVISIENAEIEVAKEGGAPTVTFTANRDWTAKVQEGETWLGVSAASGKASADKQTITITVDPNDAFDRSATVTIALAGGLGSKDITVKQAGKGENPDVGGKGEGTLESPYDVAKALEVANALNDGEYTDTKVYVKGIVSSIKNASGIAKYGNIDFYISDDGKDDAETRFLVFQSLYLGGAKFTSEDQLKIGDEVVIYGKLTNYMGNTPETEGKGQTFIYSLNGKGGDPVDKPSIDDKDAIYANNFDKEKAEKTYGSGSSYPFLDQFDGWKNEKGTGVSAVEYEFKGMSARSNSESDGSYSEYAGSGVNNLFFGADAHFEIKNIALGSVQNLSLQFGADKYDQKGSSLFNHDEFKVYVSNDRSKWVSLDYAFEAGDPEGVWRIASTVFTVPAGTESLCIYISASAASVYRIDDIVLSPSETAGTEIDFSKGEDLGTGGGDEPGVDPGQVEQISCAEFISRADENTTYRLKGKVTSSVNATYCSFDMSDDDGVSTVVVWTVLNKDEWSSKVKQGGTVTVRGKYLRYQKDESSPVKHEMVDAYIEAFEEGGGEDPKPGDVIEATVAEFLAAEVSTTQKYQLTGTITNIADATYGNIYIKDETATVYVYGLTATEVAKNDQSFATLGLKVGDIVTLVGYRAVYNDSPQVANAYYVSHVEGEPEAPANVLYTTLFGPDYNNVKISNYTSSWYVTNGGFKWNLVNWNNNNNGWEYVRCGSKNAASVATITTDTAIPQKISEVVLTLNKVSNLNSDIKLEIASEESFEGAEVISVAGAVGEVKFTIDNPSENMYYRLTFDNKKASGNGSVELAKIQWNGPAE